MIVDASVALKWFFPEDGSDRAFALIGSGPLNAPSLIHVEVGNAIWKKHRRGQIVGDPLSIDLRLLDQVLAITPDDGLAARALDFAIAIDHAIYDCIYLSLAEQLDEPFVTADAKFARKLDEAKLPVRLELLA